MATNTIEIVFPERAEKCSIFFVESLLENIPFDQFSGASSLAIVSDDVVTKLYARKIRKRLSQASKTHLIAMEHGERNKTLATASRIARKMSDLGLDRKSVLLAVGGGVVGDLTGFVASIFKRGIRYYQIPTTLLAQVDSSIGGKCGVDTEWGKNQIGTFHQPAGIFIDGSFLDTLPGSEVVNGLAEIIKSSIIADISMFDKIESSVEDYFNIQNLKGLVKRTCEIKAKIVEADEKETGLRKILNYGHTVGHAIESSSSYRLSHGRSIILGMICEGFIANKLGILRESEFLRQKNVLAKIKSHYNINFKAERRKILSFALLDKKSTGGVIMMSLPEKLGAMHPGHDGGFTVPVSRELFLESLDCLNAVVR